MNSANPSIRTAKIVINNSIDEMAKVADLVERFGAEHAVPQQAVDNLNICLDELLNNTISYGYSDQERHEITIVVSVRDGALLTAEIRDDAAPFDPRAAPAPALDGSVGGLGIHFVRSLMDEIAYTRDGNCNMVKISKKLQPEAGPNS